MAFFGGPGYQLATATITVTAKDVARSIATVVGRPGAIEALVSFQIMRIVSMATSNLQNMAGQ